LWRFDVASGSPAKKFKRENTTIESIDGKRTSGVWVDLLENGDFIARVLVNVEASENIVLSLILNSLREQYCEVFLNASDFSIYSGLNNEICLPSREEWILESHGGGWSNDLLLVKYTRSDVPNQLIPDGMLVSFLITIVSRPLLYVVSWAAHHLFSIWCHLATNISKKNY
jgi:hypothetical protein